MKTWNFSAVLLAIFLLNMISAQDKWWIELRPNLDFPIMGSDHMAFETGFGFEATFGYRFLPHLGGYAGWGYNTFPTEASTFAGTGATDVDETGYTFGLQFIRPFGSLENMSYLLRVGGIYSHIEIENGQGEITADSGHGLGWEVGTGIQLDMGKNWNLRPQLGYRALSRDIGIGTETTDVELNYISIGLGISKLF